ncbi:MAG: hypothetical protein WA213_20950 [Terriglobales bacterium]
MKNTKYAVVGELVTIVTPLEFVRCGYPLSIKGIMCDQFEEIEKDCDRMFAALERKPMPPEVSEPNLADESSVDSWLKALPASGNSNMSATVHGMLCAAAAAFRLEKANFGGKERRIFEKDGRFEAGEVWTVIGRKMVKTGVRYPSRVYRDSWPGEIDYEPGGLEGEKSHCVYRVKRNGHEAYILASNTSREANL